MPGADNPDSDPKYLSLSIPVNSMFRARHNPDSDTDRDSHPDAPRSQTLQPSAPNSSNMRVRGLHSAGELRKL